MVEKNVSFKSDSHMLSGTILLPDNQGVFPCVLLIAGSGQVDRNENHKNIHLNVFFDIANHLVKHGIATFRYDKRGVGESRGNYYETGFYDNVNDALSAFELISAQSEIDKNGIYILGHSEGALITVRILGQKHDAAGGILLGGAAHSGEEILRWQLKEVVKNMRGFNKFIIKLFKIDVVKQQQKYFNKIKSSSKNTIRIQLVNKLNAKWFREFLSYDPLNDLKNIESPILAITGEKDIQVPPSDLDLLKELIKSNVVIYKLPDITHILRIDKNEPKISDYKNQVKYPVDKQILEIICEWVQN
jgi:fermentation-respiration switch protein FrsA (DUF1100 family)